MIWNNHHCSEIYSINKRMKLYFWNFKSHQNHPSIHLSRMYPKQPTTECLSPISTLPLPKTKSKTKPKIKSFFKPQITKFTKKQSVTFTYLASLSIIGNLVGIGTNLRQPLAREKGLQSQQKPNSKVLFLSDTEKTT